LNPLTRRRFLQVGLAGAAVLATTRALGKRAYAPATPHRFLEGDAASLVGALAGVVLAGALPPSPTARSEALREVVDAFDRAVSGLAPAIRDEIGQLLGLLRFRPARYAFTGIWAPLHEAPPAEIAAFLARWRESRFDLLRAGYQAITQLLQAAWYDNPRAWPAIGYPGPPALASR
jgi:hypothetical protein